MAIKRVLVTGGGGFLGKAIVKKLIEKDLIVTSLSRAFYPELESLGVHQIQGDLADPYIVAKAIKDIDVVYHVAAKAGAWGAFDDYYKVNVTGTQNVIEACFKNNVKQLIYTSSPSVVFDQFDKINIDESTPYSKNYLTAYPETKGMAEKLVRKAALKGLNTIIIRPHAIWGPGDNHLLPRIIKKAKRLKRIGRDECLLDTLYVDNAADVHILASNKLLENPSLSGNVYFVSQGEPIKIWDMVDALLDVAGLPPVKGHISANVAFKIGSIFEFIYRSLRIKKEPPLTRFMVTELSTHHYFNISKVKQDLGYSPKVSTQEGLNRLKAWYSNMDG